MNTTDRSGVIRLAEAEMGIPGPAGERSVLVLQRGTLDIKLSVPLPPNDQAPHAQDEIYVIIRGRGVLFHDGRRETFESGDILFVAAGTEHHYEDFTEDLALWRVFYGPVGGEIPAWNGGARATAGRTSEGVPPWKRALCKASIDFERQSRPSL